MRLLLRCDSRKTLEDVYGQIPQLYRDALLLAVTISIRLFLGW